MNKEISFWHFLKANKIVIPILQRDYAQGRVGKEYLRNSFLQKIKEALDGKSTEGEKTLKLDFVYGSKDGDDLKPLDGQQRLTTLWLLHWFIAYKAGKLADKEVRNNLLRFTYETRNSSRDFCEKLVNEGANLTLSDIEKIKAINLLKEGEEISEENKSRLNKDEIEKIKDPNKDNCLIREALFYKKKDEILRPYFVSCLIQNQTWFYSGWKQDPTVQGMLRMLGGGYTPLGDGSDLIDGLEEIFLNTSENEYQTYWSKLTDDKEPAIVFYHLPMHDFGLADDLYIKMNARGKPLSDFENFKADLIDYINDKAQNDKENPKEWKTLSSTLPQKIDSDWTDIFWPGSEINNKLNSETAKNIDKLSEEKRENLLRVDERFHIFINRIFWDKLFTAKKENSGGHNNKEEYVLKLSKQDEKNPSFEYLNSEIIDKELFGNLKPEYYKGLSLYQYLPLNTGLNSSGIKEERVIPIDVFKDLKCILDWYNKLEESERELFDKILSEGNFNFIPQLQILENGNSKELSDENGGEDNKNKMTQPKRIIFHAVCKYIKERKEGPFDTESFRKWMRVIYNLIAGIDEQGRPQIRTEEAVRTAIEFIDDSLNSHSVYESLTKLNPNDINERSAFGLRIKEEIEKAKKILKDSDFEKKIIEAESIPVFNRTIRFLYEGDGGWEDFDTKKNTAWEYFKNPKFKEEVILSCFFKLFKEEDLDKILNKLVFNNNNYSWLNLLLSSELSHIVHKFLMPENLNENDSTIDKKEEKENDNKSHNKILELLSTPEFLASLKNEKKISLRQEEGSGLYYLITKRAWKEKNAIYLNYKDRDDFLSSINHTPFFSEERFHLYKGSSIEFEYNGQKFKWDIDGGERIYSQNPSISINTKGKTAAQIKEELDKELEGIQVD